jgi:thioredoxin 1
MKPRWSIFIVMLLLLQTGCGQEGTPAGRGEDPGAVLTLSDANFPTEVLASKEPVLVDMWAAWCRPCQEMKPIIKKVAVRFAGRAKVGEIDSQAHRFTAEKYQARTFPLVLIFFRGEVIKRLDGPQTEEELVDALTEVLAQSVKT